MKSENIHDDGYGGFSSEWYEGYYDYHDGLDISINPYIIASLEHEIWEEGWLSAQHDNENRNI